MSLPSVEIGRRLREVRESLEIPIASVASALGVPEGTVVEIEAGTLKELPGDYILVLARLYRTDFRYFISSDLDDVEGGVRQVFRSLAAPTPAQKLAIRRFIVFAMGEAEAERLLERA